MFGVPINGDRGQVAQLCNAEALSFAGAVADFALAASLKGVFPGLVRLAFVGAGLGAALHVVSRRPKYIPLARSASAPELTLDTLGSVEDG